MKWVEFINYYYNRLQNKKDYDKNDAYIIISNICKISLNEFRLDYMNKEVSEDEKRIAKDMLDKYYIYNIPLAYITGYTYFYNEKYIVNSDVLIPRSDTETLVKSAINYICSENISKVLDMCCGSGAVRYIYCKKF